MIKPRIGSYAVYEPAEEGWENWQEQLDKTNQILEKLGLDVVSVPEAVKDLASMEKAQQFLYDNSIDLLHVLVVSWSFDHYTIEIQQKLGVPVVIRSIPGIRSGSLVGAQQLASVLSDLDVQHQIQFGEIEDTSVAHDISNYAKACAIIRKLQGSRVGVIGRRTEGMTPIAVDEIEILRLFGIRLINYGLDEFEKISLSVDRNETESLRKKLEANASGISSKPEYSINSIKNYLAAKKIIEKHNLKALTIGSYPLCQGKMCVPIALLNEEGVPAGCEGDVNATINMLILSWLSDQPIHFGEMLEIDKTENALVTSHCGCGSPSLADSDGYNLTPVRLANDGVCIRFSSKPGQVTFVNLVGRKDTYRMCAFQGEAVRTGLVFEGNPMRIQMESSFEVIWDYLREFSFGHHWMTVYNHVVPVLRYLCSMKKICGVFPDIDEVV